LSNRSVPTGSYPFYGKWLRFYLDFCQNIVFQKLNEKAWIIFCGNAGEKANFCTTTEGFSLVIRFLSRSSGSGHLHSALSSRGSGTGG
jgi:hypothetical protein